MEQIKACLVNTVRADGKEPTTDDWTRARNGLDELSAIFTAAKPLLDYSRKNLIGNDAIIIYHGEMQVFKDDGERDWQKLYQVSSL